MKKWLYIILLLPFALKAQYNEEISVVQFSAKFLCHAELSPKELKKIDGAHIYTIYLSEETDLFIKENITFLPTLILYHNNKRVLKIQSDIRFKLPKNSIHHIQKEINLIKTKEK
tara:strand:- start:257 stop:601 length:345 start_codon:yes stop_codon:yes gene_type:complete